MGLPSGSTLSKAGTGRGRLRWRAGKQASWKGSRAPRSHGLHGGALVQDEDYTAVSITDSMTTEKTWLVADAGHTLRNDRKAQ